MRIISGLRRGLKLETPKGMNTRPTTDRIKETLFNMIGREVPGCRFLDLFAGSGQIGLEALSRGASTALFIERNRQACDCIRANIQKAGFEDQSELICGDVLHGIAAAAAKGPFHIVFMDPPYEAGLERPVLDALCQQSLLAKDGLIILEAALATDLGFLEELGLRARKVKQYKTNQHLFIERAS